MFPNRYWFWNMFTIRKIRRGLLFNLMQNLFLLILMFLNIIYRLINIECWLSFLMSNFLKGIDWWFNLMIRFLFVNIINWLLNMLNGLFLRNMFLNLMTCLLNILYYFIKRFLKVWIFYYILLYKRFQNLLYWSLLIHSRHYCLLLVNLLNNFKMLICILIDLMRKLNFISHQSFFYAVY